MSPIPQTSAFSLRPSRAFMEWLAGLIELKQFLVLLGYFLLP